MRPYVKEAEDYSDDDIEQLFDKSDEFCFSHRDSYTGCKYNYPLSEWIKSLTETKKEWVNKIILNHVINFLYLFDMTI